MSRFLFASTPIAAHSSNPLPIAARLVERGHQVDWYAGRAFHARIAEVGANPIGFVEAHDFSDKDIYEHFPKLQHRSGPGLISDVFADVFIGQARARVDDLQRILADRPADAMLCDALMFGVGLVHELGGPRWATFGDGPMPFPDDDTPPFGPGMLPVAGPLGRLRNRAVAALAQRLIFARPQRVYEQTRSALGLPPDARTAMENVTSPYLHLQACTPSFEYPRRSLPAHVHWVGALRPDRPRAWPRPEWWGDLDGSRPVVHVTQGSLRPDLAELIVPSLKALANLDVLVVVTTGGADEPAVAAAYGGTLPSNARIASFVPYDLLLEHVDVFITNGGYTGVTLALHHGVPIVQAGVTEEKAEIAARIAWSGAGLRLGKSHPKPSALLSAVQRVLHEPRFKRAAGKIRDEMAAHDASREAADRLEQLASTGPCALSNTCAAHRQSSRAAR